MAKTLKDILKPSAGGHTRPNDGNVDMIKDHPVEVHADRVGNKEVPYVSNKEPAKFKKSEKAQHGCICGDTTLTSKACPMHGEAKAKKVDEAVGVSNNFRKAMLKQGVRKSDVERIDSKSDEKHREKLRGSFKKEKDAPESPDPAKKLSSDGKGMVRQGRASHDRQQSSQNNRDSIYRNVAKLKGVKEEVITELSDTKLKSYVAKAEGDVSDKKSVAKQASSLKDKYAADPAKAKSAERVADKYSKKAEKRTLALSIAKKKLKEGLEGEDLHEISKSLASRYISKIKNRDTNRNAAGLEPIKGQYGDKHEDGKVLAGKKITGKGVKVPATDKKD